MAIVIKKRVSLEFLGEEYKEAYLVFKSVPALDFTEIKNKIDEIKADDQKSLEYLIQILKKYFLGGKFPDDAGELQDVVKDDLDQLDPESLLRSFQIFTGQELDPKAPTPLTSSSPTAELPQ